MRLGATRHDSRQRHVTAHATRRHPTKAQASTAQRKPQAKHEGRSANRKAEPVTNDKVTTSSPIGIAHAAQPAARHVDVPVRFLVDSDSGLFDCTLLGYRMLQKHQEQGGTQV